MIKAVIFDFFGVLVTDALQAMSDDLRRTNPAAVTEVSDLVRAMNRGMVDVEEARQQMAGIFGLDRAVYETRIKESEVRNTALLEYIKELRTDYKTGILSNVPSGSLSRRFSNEELAEYFDVVVASGDIQHIKPEPEAYLITAERLDTEPSECVFIDDRENQVAGAVAVGMKGIHYQDYTQFRRELDEILSKG